LSPIASWLIDMDGVLMREEHPPGADRFLERLRERGTGRAASKLAAHISGASWGSGATALRQAWRRARPTNLDTFALG